jgi:hypothetical protein
VALAGGPGRARRPIGALAHRGAGPHSTCLNPRVTHQHLRSLTKPFVSALSSQPTCRLGRDGKLGTLSNCGIGGNQPPGPHVESSRSPCIGITLPKRNDAGPPCRWARWRRWSSQCPTAPRPDRVRRRDGPTAGRVLPLHRRPGRVPPAPGPCRPSARRRARRGACVRPPEEQGAAHPHGANARSGALRSSRPPRPLLVRGWARCYRGRWRKMYASRTATSPLTTKLNRPARRISP